MKTTILSITVLALVSLPASALASGPDHAGAHDANAGGHEEARAEPAPGNEVLVTLSVPLMSPLFSETPVAAVEGEPITVSDLTKSITSIHSGRVEEATSARKSYANLLERIITRKLIVQEARNIGFDEMPEIAGQIDDYAKKFLITSLMLPQMESVEPDEELVDDLYRQMSRELLLTALKFRREEDALAFQEEYESSGDFDATARRFIDEGRADGEIEGEQYMKLKDLLPAIAKKAYEMDVGSVSPIFSESEGFILFHLEDARFYEDPVVREEARTKFMEPLRKKAADDYIDQLIAKHATIDEKLLEEVDFDWSETGFLWSRKEQPVDFEQLRSDQRVLATVNGDESFTVTVADITEKIEARHFHGVEKAAKKRKLNKEKDRVLRNVLFERAAMIEARSLGLDRDAEYLQSVDDFESATLFGTFINKVVAPDVKLEEEDVKKYYREHLGEFSSPTMYRMSGLAFSERSDAEKALVKLRRRADFKWVSANSPGQVDKGAALFDNALLSLTAMPEDLHHLVEGTEQGDSLLYSSPEGQHHVIAIAKVFPSKPQPYETVRGEIAKIVFERKMAELVDDWSGKLKEAYETRIFVTELAD